MVVDILRHGKTQGNLEKRYISTTDESLCIQGIEELKKIEVYPDNTVFVSPMKRCKETASILFPNAQQIICNGFQECNFGEFENKNYEELKTDIKYKKWLESIGKLDFPNGENTKKFEERSCSEFEKIINQYQHLSRICIVAHGGTIMAILNKYIQNSLSFYDWQVKNGQGYRIILDIQKMIAKVVDKLNEDM